MNKQRKEGIVIKVKIIPKIHPARKFLIAKTLEEKCEDIKVSVIEDSPDAKEN